MRVTEESVRKLSRMPSVCLVTLVGYSRVPNKRTGAFNRTEEKKQPELISVQCTINVQRGLNCQN